MRAKFYRYNLKQVRSAFMKYNADFFDKLGRLQLSDWEQAAAVSDGYFQDAFKSIYKTTGTYYAEKIIKKLQPQKWESMNYWTYYFENYGKEKAAHRITWITHVTESEFKRITRNVISQAIENGWGEEKAGRELRKEIGFSEKYRADRIARTETVSASNAGNIEGAKSMGMNLLKEWISAYDDRVRGSKPGDQFDHLSMNGVQVPMNEDFEVPTADGGTEALEYPGDPNGSAGNVINCRCSVQFVPIE